MTTTIPTWQIILYLFAAYLLGSIPTAYLAGRLLRGVDIRDYGSGNVGGTITIPHQRRAMQTWDELKKNKHKKIRQ